MPRPAGRDDARAKEVVLQLVSELGFDGVDAGGSDVPRMNSLCVFGLTSRGDSHALVKA